MRQDAEKFAEQDLKQKELIEARNNADNMAYQAEKAMEELEKGIPVLSSKLTRHIRQQRQSNKRFSVSINGYCDKMVTSWLRGSLIVCSVNHT